MGIYLIKVAIMNEAGVVLPVSGLLYLVATCTYKILHLYISHFTVFYLHTVWKTEITDTRNKLEKV